MRFSILFATLVVAMVQGAPPLSKKSSPLDVLSNISQAVDRDLFVDFVRRFNKVYTSEKEVLERFTNFIDSLREIERLNTLHMGETTFAVNQFSDMTWKEFQKSNLARSNVTPPANLDLPANWDWRSSGIVGPVKNQGSCGSCWAFATSALVESLAAKSGRGLNSYAEQQLVDCIEGGCDGGNMEHALGYAQDHGLPFESDYPYHQSRGQCHDAPIRIKLTKMTGIDHNEDNMAWSCKDGGPFVVSFKVGNSLMHYSGGVLSNTDCDNDNAWHAVAVIGFGTDNGNRYWLAKNQWGTGWGESGYFRVRRGSNWCMWASDPLGGWV